MKKMFLFYLISHFLFSIAIVYSQEVKPENLIYMCEDIPPSNYLDNGKLKGASVEILKLIWIKIGCPEQPINVVPWARGYEIVQNEKNNVLFSMTRTLEREKLFKWVGPIFSANHVLLGRTGNNIKLNNLDDAKKYKIGLIKDDISELYLLTAGFDKNNLEQVSSLDQNFEKLLLGRIDFIAHSEDTFKNYIKMHNLKSEQFKIFIIVSKSPHYYAFNKDTPDSIINIFQQALDSIKKEQLEILARYNINL
jgi:polar amino acid transport system substrate-binding protein